MERHRKEMTVKEVMKKAKCSKCQQKNSFEFRIIYYGNTPAQSLGLWLIFRMQDTTANIPRLSPCLVLSLYDSHGIHLPTPQPNDYYYQS